MTSMSLIERLAFVITFSIAGIGPCPIIEGSTPDSARATIRIRGVSPSVCAWVAVVKTTAAAPSLIPDELPAVTLPFLRKTGRKFASLSIDVARGCSSVSKVNVSRPF